MTLHSMERKSDAHSRLVAWMEEEEERREDAEHRSGIGDKSIEPAGLGRLSCTY